MTIGEKIRFFRNLRGYSQEAMAHELNISTTAYAKIERNETNVSLVRLQEIAQVLKVELEVITSLSDDKYNFHNHAHSNANNVVANKNYQEITHHPDFSQERNAYLMLIDNLREEVKHLRQLVEHLTRINPNNETKHNKEEN
ncbi:MAG: XRE family transcriptional regulator [Cytophagales bacterium]|nr:MAG: XRE family transcriptional regulator [Cytophagales bacterium]